MHSYRDTRVDFHMINFTRLSPLTCLSLFCFILYNKWHTLERVFREPPRYFFYVVMRCNIKCDVNDFTCLSHGMSLNDVEDRGKREKKIEMTKAIEKVIKNQAYITNWSRKVEIQKQKWAFIISRLFSSHHFFSFRRWCGVGRNKKLRIFF